MVIAPERNQFLVITGHFKLIKKTSAEKMGDTHFKTFIDALERVLNRELPQGMELKIAKAKQVVEKSL